MRKQSQRVNIIITSYSHFTTSKYLSEKKKKKNPEKGLTGEEIRWPEKVAGEKKEGVWIG